jgi:iron complex outermembrane receptor protein
MKKLILAILLLPFATFCLAQNLKGRIVDDEGRPVAGTNIVIKGTPNGTTANANGEFQIQMPGGKSTLVIVFVGYKNLEKEVLIENTGNYQLDVVLVKKMELLRPSSARLTRS